jgi:lipid-binding SYLF domain-containing protein
MKSFKTVFVMLSAMLIYCFSLSSALAKDEALKISNASKVIKEISAVPKRKIPPVLFNEASAIVIIPKARKNDFMVSGGSAMGVLLIHDKNGAWSNPPFLRISGGTLGWQIVADPLDIILVFKNIKHVDAILKDRLVIDAKVKIESGWLGPNLKGATSKELKAEIASYLRSHGKLAEEFTLAGTTLLIDAASNDTFYGKSKIELSEILTGKGIKANDEVKALQKILTDYAAGK